jgi:hypothetical protein
MLLNIIINLILSRKWEQITNGLQMTTERFRKADIWKWYLKPKGVNPNALDDEKNYYHQVWCYTAVILALGKLRQKAHKLIQSD